tara:strand:+ start:1989 stop:2576 length:588 start_codon:yes stop_codon:yes gene_type:complete
MIHYIKHYFKDDEPRITEWDEPRERQFEGKTVKGRPTKGYGSSSFDYAGKLYKPDPWTYPMTIIKEKAEKLIWEEFGIHKEFTFCLCGYYARDGKGIPHHSDTVPTLDDLVVSISFGAPRVFIQRTYQNPIKDHTNTSEIKDLSKENFIVDERFFVLEHGDVLMFDGHNQMKSTHAVPDLQNTEKRINLTFRTGL